MARRRNRILEAINTIGKTFGIRVKPIPSPTSQIPVAKKGKTLADQLEELEGSPLVDISELNKFRTLSDNREVMYRMYDEMALDSIIASVIEMYADDATQYNSKGDIIWAESSDQDIAKFANRLIDVLDLNKNAWSHIYSMVKYGDVYLETYKDDEIDDDPLLSKELSYNNTISIKEHKVGAKLEEYIERYPNPAEIFDLTKRGKTVGFIKVPVHEADTTDPIYAYQHISVGEETEILPPDKYIHISLATNTERFPETLSLSFGETTDDVAENTISHTYDINRGKSILHDIYKIYKELQLMEDSLLLNRVTRSSIIRLLQIEVGDMPKSQARELLKRVKQLIEQKNYMDKNAGTYQSMASPGPIDNVIYIPTHEGKGTITSANLGGDVDVKSIADLDYYRQKLAGALKVPLAYLYGTAMENGLGGGTSLTKMDSRYARTIKRIQNAYISGITTLINIFAISKGLTDHVNNFTVKMVTPSTIEDQERDEILDNRMNMVGTLMDLIGNEDMTTPETRKEIMILLMNSFLNEPEIATILENDNTADNSENDGEDNDFGGDFSTDFDNDININTGSDNESDVFSDLDTGGGPEDIDTGSEDFGDFSDEV